MRIKRNKKIPQNLEDFVHSINTMKTKNKVQASEKNTQKVNKHVGGGNRGEQSQDESVFGSKCRNEEIAESKRNECDGFDGNLSGDQFPPISAQKRNKNDVDNKDCLDNDAGGIEKGSSDCRKDDGVSEGSVSKPVNMNEIGYVTYNEAMYHLMRMWNKYGFMDILKNDEGVFFFKFQDEKGMDEVVSNGPWLVNNKAMFVQKWRTVKGIIALASSLRKPIIMDDMTAKMCAKGEGRLSFSRVLIEIDVGRELKKEIEVVNKESKCHDKFTKKIQVEGEVNVAHKEDVMLNAEKPFTIVHNRRENFTRENQNKNKWNGYNGYNGKNINRRYYRAQNRYYNGNGNNGRWDYRKKQDTTKGSTSGGDNRDEIHKIKESVNDAEYSSYNRFTLLNELVREEELVPSVAQRKIVDEYMNKEKDESGIGNQGWSKEMERYYRDRKELFDATKDLEQDEDVECDIHNEEEFGKRNELWKDLGSQKIITNGEPWVTLGDFNVTLKVEEHSNRSSIPSNEMNEYAETLKKLDRILISEAFMDKFQTANGMFLPYLISDHSPTILRLPNGMAKRKKDFRFSNFVTDKKEFSPIVKKAWEVEVEGHMMYKVSRDSLKNIQAEVDKYPHNEDIKVKSCKILSEYYEAMKDENNLLMQKAKIEWLKDGYRNTEFFHKIVKGRMHKGRIVSVCNEKGERFENDQVAEQFVKHFQWFLGKKDVVTEMPKDKIVFPNKLSIEETIKMCKNVSEVEVKNVMFEIEDSKAPDLMSAFIAGRQITENILLAQELFKGYYRKQKIKKVAFKIDLQKAYDTINWDFLRVVLEKFGFPEKMVKWITVCVSTTMFSININGEREGYFIGGRGLRQGDPMSPYLFTLVMEAFNLIMRKNINDTKEFKYHQGCQKLGITHLCFADDLLVFCHGDHKPVNVIKKALEEFSSYSGLKANMSKSTVFFGGLTNAKQESILDIVPFAIERLPVRYLGVPLLTKKINATDCKPLVEKVKYRVPDWRNKAISYSGRLQLIAYVLRIFVVPREIDKREGKGPICDIVTTREIYEANLNIDTNMAELVTKYEGTWPEGWSNEYPILNQSGISHLEGIWRKYT
ncbi:RNA-directed DNA polymerase, eukaryota, reverse transcriptase zinc-binding domain protein [Tanacetum coccineum]